MSPTNLQKRRSLNPDDQQPQKRPKLSTTTKPRMGLKPSKLTTTLNAPLNPHRSRTEAALNLFHANSLSSTQFTNQYFPSSSQIFTAEDGTSYTCTFRRTQDLFPEEKEACFQIIKDTSRKDYEANAEDGWDDGRKKEEMGEEGMRFVLVRKAEKIRKDTPSNSSDNRYSQSPKKQDEDSSDILGFSSFTLEIDPDTHIPQLYLYEIHLRPPVRSLGLGGHLMSLSETLARKLGLEKVMLTVFTCNTRAEALYRRLGYEVDEQSPEERVLRSGKVVRPKYLILSKTLLNY